MENGYHDPEFGWIDGDIFRMAKTFWETYGRDHACSILDGDEGAAWRLLLKAAAITTESRARPGVRIENLGGYFYRTYQRELRGESKNENRHRQLNEKFLAGPETARGVKDEAEGRERAILIDQVVKRMDPWTLRVFRLLVLGYSFNEIAEELDMEANAVRARYSKSMARLKKQFEDDDDDPSLLTRP